MRTVLINTIKTCILVSIAICLFTLGVSAEQLRKTNGYKWGNKYATVYFYCGFNSTWKTEISSAMTSWNNVKNSHNETIVPMAFTSNSNHVNKIYSTSGETWIGKNFPTHSNGILSADSVVFNSGSYTFTVGAKPGKYDIQSVAVHELGHALGIAHCHQNGETSCFSNTCSSNVMNPTIHNNSTRRNLTSYDSASKRTIYQQ